MRLCFSNDSCFIYCFGKGVSCARCFFKRSETMARGLRAGILEALLLIFLTNHNLLLFWTTFYVVMLVCDMPNGQKVVTRRL